jgi:cytochrome d ubiquinol oxidase subunit I
MRTEEGVSVSVTGGMVVFSLFVFAVVYGALMVVDIYLLAKHARQGVPAKAGAESPSDERSSALAAAN